MTCATVDFHSIFIVKHIKEDLRSAACCIACVTAVSAMFPVPDAGKGNANETLVSSEKVPNCLNRRDGLMLLCRSEFSSTHAVES